MSYNGYQPPQLGARQPTPTNANAGANGNPAGPVGNNPKVQPLLCSGHTRPVVHLQFSNM
jgi:serine-threonine kinase receptor-associated protein